MIEYPLITSPSKLIQQLGKEIIYYDTKYSFNDFSKVKIFGLGMGSNCIRITDDIHLTINSVAPSWIYNPMEDNTEEYGDLEVEFKNAHIILLCNLSMSIINSLRMGSSVLKTLKGTTLLIYNNNNNSKDNIDKFFIHRDNPVINHPISYYRIPYTSFDCCDFNNTAEKIKKILGTYKYDTDDHNNNGNDDNVDNDNTIKNKEDNKILTLTEFSNIISILQKPRNRESKLTVITGGMAAGKSSRLLQLIMIHNTKSVLIIPRCVQLNKMKCRSYQTEIKIEIRSETYLNYKDYIHYDNIYIEDAHLFNDNNLTQFVHICQSCGIDITIAGLSVSCFKNDKFKGFGVLMSQATTLELLTAPCTLCNYHTAKLSFRYNWRKPSNFVGDHRKYLNVCTDCLITELAPQFLNNAANYLDVNDINKMCQIVL
ncbi:Thymidine kinase [Astathelohania contejeani]|uniref:thymidine kinase n=1 Tax=Astathelohania contejeani TaxID=164912 RepID=A0ABQ7HVU6_9MICR|nr:Thymidine kinase [Thelohania contejeani]